MTLPLSVLTCIVAGFVLALTSNLVLSQVKQPFMSVAEIQPGMKGYGLTVFRGETPERFGVEVIDVLHRFRPDQDLILIRTLHPILDLATTVAGMSGSPIYIDDRLIGAYAYGWTFGKEPIAGVTPIANMMEELARPVDPRIWKALGTMPKVLADMARPAPAARVGGTHRYGDGAFAALREQRRVAAVSGNSFEAPDTAWGRPLPAATPLQVSGLGERSTELLARELGPYGMFPVQAGASAGPRPGKTKGAPPKFVDGGSIGVQLVRGDISMVSTGTVTHVAGQRLVAFGHPMLNAGQVALPTCTTRVVHVLSSTMRSFKMAEPVAPLGTLIHDRQSAIVIDQQLQADMLPMTVRLHGVPDAARSEWHMELVENRLLTAGLVLSALNNAIEASVSERTDTVITVDSRVRIEGHGEQRSQDVVFTPAGPSDGQALGRLHLFAILNAAFGNPFEDVRITGVDVDVNVRFERDVINLVNAQLASDTVDPGSTVQVALTLRHYDQSEQVQVVPVHIPESAAGETLELSIEPGDEVELERPKPNSLDDLLRALRTTYAGTSLVLSTKMPMQGVKLRGQMVRSLPGSALDMLQPQNESDRGTLFSSYERKELPLGHAVIGSAKLKVNVRAEPVR